MPRSQGGIWLKQQSFLKTFQFPSLSRNKNVFIRKRSDLKRRAILTDIWIHAYTHTRMYKVSIFQVMASRVRHHTRSRSRIIYYNTSYRKVYTLPPSCPAWMSVCGCTCDICTHKYAHTHTHILYIRTMIHPGCNISVHIEWKAVEWFGLASEFLYPYIHPGHESQISVKWRAVEGELSRDSALHQNSIGELDYSCICTYAYMHTLLTWKFGWMYMYVCIHTYIHTYT
jgi:hypothetical protein